MAGLWSDHFPATEKTPNKNSPCRSTGVWSELFRSAEKSPSPAETQQLPSTPLPRSQQCLLCPTCNTSCRLFTSKTDKNPNRQFYKCSVCNNFFKWADQVTTGELIDVPYCGGCSAGLCRVCKETNGPNAGRILFMCRVKEGEGSCGYRVWQDELGKAAEGGDLTSSQSPKINTSLSKPTLITENNIQIHESPSTSNGNHENPSSTILIEEIKSPEIERTGHVTSRGVTYRETEKLKSQENKCDVLMTISRRLSDVRETSFQSPPSNGGHTMPAYTNLVEENSKSDEEQGDDELTEIDSSENLHHHGITSNKIEKLKCRENQPHQSSRSPHKISGLGGSNGDISSPQDPAFTVQDKTMVNNPVNLTTLTRILLGVETHNTPRQNARLSHTKSFPANPNIPNPMSASISRAFSKAAEQLQHDFLSLLKKTEPKDHQTMSLAARDTFAALDLLSSDHTDLRAHTEEYIYRAMSLAELERGDEVRQLLSEQWSAERMRLDEMGSAHAEVVEFAGESRRHLERLHEEVASAVDRLFQVDAELSGFEVEMRGVEEEIGKIQKSKKALEEKYATVAEELERSSEVVERKEAAKAAFEQARRLLLG